MSTGVSFLDQLFATQVYVADASGGMLNIGYFTDKNYPCQGNIFVYKDFVDEFAKGWYPPSAWMLKRGFSGVLNLSMSEYCVSKGLAPSWAHTSGTAVVADSPNGQWTVNPGVQPSAPLSVQDLETSAGAAIAGVKLPTSIGGLPTGAVLLGGGVLGLILILKR